MWTTISLVSLLLLLIILIQIPAVQTLVAKAVAKHYSKELGVEIKIEKIHLSPFLEFSATNVEIKDQKDSCLLASKKIFAFVDKLSLKDKELKLKSISIFEPQINMAKYRDEAYYNFQFLLDYFSSDKKEEKSNKWSMSLSNLSLRSAKINFTNHNKAENIIHNVDFNNIKVSHLNVDISDFSMKDDEIQLALNNFSFLEKSGFWLKSLNSFVKYSSSGISLQNSRVETSKSQIKFDLRLSYKSTADFENFMEDVLFDVKVKSSHINTNDLSYFIKDSYPFNNIVNFQLDAKGSVNNLIINNIIFSTLNNTNLYANANIKGLPVIEKSNFKVEIHQFNTNIQDIQKIKLPNNKSIKTPSSLSNFGKISSNGSIIGNINDFVADMDFFSNAGDISTFLRVQKLKNTYAYEGNIKTQDFNPSLFSNDLKDLTSISLNSSVKGSGTNLKNANLKLNGEISEIVHQKHKGLNNINLHAHYNKGQWDAQVDIKDPNLDLELNSTGSIKKDEERIALNGQIYNFNISHFNFWKKDKITSLKTSFQADISGFNPDEMLGTVNLNRLVYTENNKDFKLSYLKLESTLDFLGMKNIDLNSDWINAEIAGRFLISDIGDIVNNILEKYVPSLIDEEGETLVQNQKTNKKQNKDETVLEQNRYLSFDIFLHDAKSLMEIFAPKVQLANNSFVNGFMSAKNKSIIANANSDFLKIPGVEISKLNLNANTGEKLEVELVCDTIFLSRKENVFLNKFQVDGKLLSDNIDFDIKWDGSNNENENRADINGNAVIKSKDIFKLSFNASDILINDSLWRIRRGGNILISKDEYAFEKLYIGKKDKHIEIDGIVSKTPDKTLEIKLKNIDLYEAEPLTMLRQFDLYGIANGKLELNDIFGNISFISNVNIQKFGLNGQRLGDAELVSVWDNRKNGLFLNVEVISRGNVGEARPVQIQGYYYPARDTIDLVANAERFRLKTIEKYLSVIMYKFDGYASGKINIFGTLKTPQIAGDIKLMRTEIGINELNTVYTTNHHLRLEKDKIVFKDLEVFDSESNMGVINGIITHNNFKNFYVDISLLANNLMALNTNQSHNDMFYGKVFGSGLIEIKGPGDNIVISAQMTSDKNTEMFIPVSFATTVSEQSYIRFVNPKDKTDIAENIETKVSSSGIQMNFLVNVTPDAKFTIFLDPSTGGTLKGSGNGTIRLEANTNGEFDMYGLYSITDGEYQMVLKDVITKKFTIEDGGTVSWNGSPVDADINLKAIYRTRASVQSLMGADSTSQFSSTAATSRRIPVNSELYLSGKLMNPDVRFGVSLPTADNTTKTIFYNLLDTTNSHSMVRQTFSLLMLGRFEPENAMYGGDMSADLESSTMNMLTSQLSSFISQYSKNLDIGVNYSKGDDTYSEELQMNFSTELFNEKLIIDGNLGVGGQNVYQQNTNQIVGDVKIEYKITNDGRIRAKAFNEQNMNEFTNINAPYTQGVAIVLRQDFDNFKDLFRFVKRKKKR